ncbi:MAG: preprotein translocase subunit SecE [Campylobacteraceae bacterium]|jgi:preprotein translocase subunit SecE|nr:preprotein translocase subunit SecE [Campylobacteraceae bacterium]
MEKMISYFRLSKAELSKVIFPLKQQVKTAFYAVIIVVTVVSLYLALIDWIMSISLKLILG